MTRLVPVDDAVLEQLVDAAVSDAAADDVTPPLTPGPAWSAERVAWLRAFHRSGERTWAVVVEASRTSPALRVEAGRGTCRYSGNDTDQYPTR